MRYKNIYTSQSNTDNISHYVITTTCELHIKREFIIIQKYIASFWYLYHIHTETFKLCEYEHFYLLKINVAFNEQYKLRYLLYLLNYVLIQWPCSCL